MIVSGIGKSGTIGRKFAATLASTGTPSLFLHAAEGSHGDLGMVTKNDVVFIISSSGETDEVKLLIPPIKRLGAKIICLTSKKNSFLAKHSDIVLYVPVKKEACPMNLAPTTSTTTFLAICDAIAVAVLSNRKFTKSDFALFHPAGTLGKRLILKVEDLMHTGKEIPLVKEDETLQNVIIEMSEKRLGVTGVVNDKKKLVGVITDGDLRRLFQREKNPWHLKAKDIMTKNPKIIKPDELLVSALSKMENYKITSLFVLKNRKIQGIIHIHDIINSGIT